MSQKANPATIGLFVAAAVLIALAALFVLGSGRLFQKTNRAVLHFQGSVAGLDPGAPVEFRGVRIGTVADVRLVFDPVRNDLDIPVYIDLEQNRATGFDAVENEPRGTRLRLAISRGLRARLENQNFITGKLKVVLLFDTNAPPVEAQAEEGMVVVPTLVSPFEELTRQVEQLPLENIASRIDESLGRLSGLIESVASGGAVSNLNRVMDSTARVAAQLEAAKVDELVGEVHALSAQIRESLEKGQMSLVMSNLNATLVKSQQAMDGVRGDLGPLRADAGHTLAGIDGAVRELGDAARAIRLLAEYLERNPEALLKGKPEGATP